MNTSSSPTCQNCKNQFVIEPEDFQFYEKMKVPPPTFCPACRFQRRLTWRNERSLYKRTCDLCEKDIIAMYPTDAPFPVYCPPCWYSDEWDGTSYGREYDFAKNFFEQFCELFKVVPRMSLFHRSSTNSQYANFVGESKNIYLSYSIVGAENTYYSKSIDKSFFIFDSLSTVESEQCYQNIYGERNYNSLYLTHSRNCMDSWFLYDCVNCKHCVLSSNLRSKEFIIRNTQYTKEGYFEELEKMNLGSTRRLEELRKEFLACNGAALHKYANILKSPGSTGNNITDTKNAVHCFDVYDVEDIKYCFRVLGLKQSMDVNFSGLGSELIYEYGSGGKNSYTVRFSTAALDGVHDVDYTDYCASSSNLFGCIGIRSKDYCILNKRYEKEAFQELRAKIISHMEQMPYVDKNGRAYKYGEFFPVELSPFAYNETVAQEYFPLTKETAAASRYAWKDHEARAYEIAIQGNALPDHIKDVDDSILDKVIGCGHEGKCNEQCTMAFKIIPDELRFYRKAGVSLPLLCPNCRHYERLRQIEPMKLWHRQCMCLSSEALAKEGGYKNTAKHPHHLEGECPNEFETPYPPDSPCIVYCEQCYQLEVV